METIPDPYTEKPTLTADGKPWVQRCYLCRKGINFLKMQPTAWVRVGQYVRHSRCRPSTLKLKGA